MHAPIAGAIAAIGAPPAGDAIEDAPGISVKLSALHPRYEAAQRERVMRELLPRVADLAQRRATPGSASRSTPRRPTGSTCRSTCSRRWPAMQSLAGWDGLGLAVQAYQKRARR